MNTIVDLNKILNNGSLESEMDFERASIIHRKLRVLVNEHPDLSEKREKLRLLIKAYENRVWLESEISSEKIKESDVAEELAEQERLFFHNRKELIKKKLRGLSLSQKDLGKILGHSSVTYISELVNGINPFTTRDLIIIHLLLKIDFEYLIPTMLNPDEREKLANAILQLGNPKLKMNGESLELVTC